MKISQMCALAVMLVLGSVMAYADGINDPKIIVHGVNGGNGPLEKCPPAGCQGVGVDFTFTTPPKTGSGQLFFTNDSGKNWTSLTLIETGEPAADITCVQSLFLNCSVTTLKNGSVEILLSGIKHGLNPENGILNGQSFSIQFACLNNSCWPGGLHFTASAGTAPEPETIALMVTGLGAIVSRRKYWISKLRS
jgi:hypothetical protein